MGMSGVGKTNLARKLPSAKWFNYCTDYRIATHYLSDAIGDFLKRQAIDSSPLLAELLKSDAINIASNVSTDNLSPLSAYIGKLGSSTLGGLDWDTFIDRQHQHLQAEAASYLDIGYFKARASRLYGYEYFLHDASGSLCEMTEKDLFEYIAAQTTVVYLYADDDLISDITKGAIDRPKPLYYNEKFLKRNLDEFLQNYDSKTIDTMPPNDFIRFIIPRLINYRHRRYKAIAEQFGKIIDAREAFSVRDEHDFLELLNS